MTAVTCIGRSLHRQALIFGMHSDPKKNHETFEGAKQTRTKWHRCQVNTFKMSNVHWYSAYYHKTFSNADMFAVTFLALWLKQPSHKLFHRVTAKTGQSPLVALKKRAIADAWDFIVETRSSSYRTFLVSQRHFQTQPLTNNKAWTSIFLVFVCRFLAILRILSLFQSERVDASLT